LEKKYFFLGAEEKIAKNSLPPNRGEGGEKYRGRVLIK
jgi:hypothetical protein